VRGFTVVLSLALGLAGIALCFGANALGIRKPFIYAVIGTFVWYAVLKSGVHATVAGVVLAFTIPARTYIDRESFLGQTRSLLDSFASAAAGAPESHSALHAMHKKLEMVKSPLHRIEHFLHPYGQKTRMD
jgi:NhaA family Na+:H+ antiporter